MIGLKEFLADAKIKKTTLGDICEATLIEKGYVKNECFGWEKLEVLKRFNLDPNMKGVPAHQIDEVDREIILIDEKDPFTNKKTGRKINQYVEKPTGKKIWVATKNYLDYLTYKKQQEKDEYVAEQILDEIKIEDL